MLAAVAVVVGAAIVVAARPPDQVPPLDPDPHPPEGVESSTPEGRDGAGLGQWLSLEPAPIPARRDAVAVWTGTDVLLWGGRSDEEWHADGAAYANSDGSWRPLPPGPVGADTTSAGVWVMQRLVVIGRPLAGADHAVGELAAYDPAAEAWRSLPAPPAGAWRWNTVAASDTLVMVLGMTGGEEQSAGSGSVAVLDMREERWRTPVDAPLHLAADWVQAVPFGQGLVVLGQAPLEGADGFTPALGLFDPEAAEWSEPSPVPLAITERDVQLRLAVDPANNRVLLAGPVHEQTWKWVVLGWDPDSRQWEAVLEEQPGELGRPQVVATELGLLVWAPGHPRLYPVADLTASLLAAHPFDDREGAAVAWTGDELFVWGGQPDGARWRPARAP